MVCSHFRKIIFLSIDVLGAFHVREEVFNLNLSTFFTEELTCNSRDIAPLRSELKKHVCIDGKPK